jgi:hypothetical protein
MDLECTLLVHLSDTRCKAHTTTSAIAKGCNSVIDASNHICSSESENDVTRRRHCFLPEQHCSGSLKLTLEPFIRFKP